MAWVRLQLYVCVVWCEWWVCVCERGDVNEWPLRGRFDLTNEVFGADPDFVDGCFMCVLRWVWDGVSEWWKAVAMATPLVSI